MTISFFLAHLTHEEKQASVLLYALRTGIWRTALPWLDGQLKSFMCPVYFKE